MAIKRRRQSQLKGEHERPQLESIAKDVMEGWPLKNFMVKIVLSSDGTVLYIICGDVLDPVILLHRLSHYANVSIPESQKEMIWLIKKYIRNRQAKNIEIRMPL